MDPESLAILKRINRYLNLIRFFVVLNVVLVVTLLATLVCGYFYVQSKLDSVTDRVDSSLDDVKSRIPSTDSLRFR